mgnify:CR=1 FL=1
MIVCLLKSLKNPAENKKGTFHHGIPSVYLKGGNRRMKKCILTVVLLLTFLLATSGKPILQFPVNLGYNK